MTQLDEPLSALKQGRLPSFVLHEEVYTNAKKKEMRTVQAIKGIHYDIFQEAKEWNIADGYRIPGQENYGLNRVNKFYIQYLEEKNNI